MVIYRKISSFIKKNIFIFLVVIFGLAFLVPFYRNEFYISHDSEPQVARSAAVYQSIMDGQVPPRWAGSLNYSYGVPSPNFFFPLMGYLTTILHVVGFSLEAAYKFIMGAAFVFSGVTFFVWLSQRFDRHISFGAALLYMLAPYHFLDIFVRGQLGEMLAFVFAPLVFYSIDKNIESKSIKYLILGVFSYALLVVSHNILALLFSIIFGLYILFFSKKINQFVRNIFTIIFGLGLSAYFWAPALFEGKYINSEIFVGGYFADHFININNLIHTSWGFGPNINEVGGLSPYIGIVHALLILISLFGLMFIKNRSQIIFWLSVFLVSIFFTIEISASIWEKFHILEQFQFPWRFIAISSFAGAVLGGYALNLIKKNILIYLIAGLILITSVSYIEVAGFTKKTDNFYLDYPGTGAYHGESTTIWTAGDASSYPDAPVEIISGSGNIYNYERKSNVHKFNVTAENDVTVKDNTTYYPGWRAYVDGEEVPIQFQDPNHRGLITFGVPSGEHNVVVRFTETVFRMITNIVSIITLILIFLVLIFRKNFDKLVDKV